MARLLVVDDDPHILELVTHCLQELGHQVSAVTDGSQALELAAQNPFDLVVLDVMLPGLDGREVCRRLRKKNNVPILMLTALGELHQKLRGFDAGADDYLAKPFETVELAARVRALLKRAGVGADPRIALGRLTLDTAGMLVHDGQINHQLPALEFRLLEKFARAPGQLFTRDQLLDSIWGNEFSGTDRTIDVYVNRLRTRFPEESYQYRITPVRGVGYRLELLP